MSIINNSHAIGVDSRNLILKTRGSLHVKVGDRYYELDFRNLASNSDKESIKESEKEQYIITVDNKLMIDGMEYPGDNKLLIGTADKSLFVTIGGKYIDISPSITVPGSVNSNTESDAIEEEAQINELHNATVYGALSNPSGLEIDFSANQIIADKLTVVRQMSYPRQTITNYCTKTNVDKSDYTHYDFLELVDIPNYQTEEMETPIQKMFVKSGVMIKSTIDADIWVSIEDYEETLMHFANESVYIIYTFNDSLTYSKL